MPKSVTIAVINYNGAEYLEDNFNSVLKLNYPNISEVLFVDNDSADNSVDIVRKGFPSVKIIETGSNLGACGARNVAIEASNSDLVFLLDKDIEFPPDVLTHLAGIFETHPETGIASAQICYYEPYGNIQYNGAYIHYAGGAIQNKEEVKPAVVGTVTANALLVDRKKALAIGLFDDDFFYGWEDGDFSFRMTIAGYPCWVVPEAKVYHKKAKRGLFWVHYQVRNRWWFMLKNYNLLTLALGFPAICFYQLAILSFLTMKGHFFGYVRGFWGVLISIPLIIRKRREVMRYKKLRDRDVLYSDTIDLAGDVAHGGIVEMISKGVNKVLSLYWVVIKGLIR